VISGKTRSHLLPASFFKRFDTNEMARPIGSAYAGCATAPPQGGQMKKLAPFMAIDVGFRNVRVILTCKKVEKWQR